MYRQSKKNLLSSNIPSTCPHNMVNFGPLAAEIVSLVWGTPDNFNGFRVLAVLLHGTLVVGVSQTAALNRRRHLYSAGQPSRWALAHILVVCILANRCSAVTKMDDCSATIDMGQKLGEVAVPLFGCGELGPHVTQCGLRRGLPSYQLAS